MQPACEVPPVTLRKQTRTLLPSNTSTRGLFSSDLILPLAQRLPNDIPCVLLSGLCDSHLLRRLEFCPEKWRIYPVIVRRRVDDFLQQHRHGFVVLEQLCDRGTASGSLSSKVFTWIFPDIPNHQGPHRRRNGRSVRWPSSQLKAIANLRVLIAWVGKLGRDDALARNFG